MPLENIIRVMPVTAAFAGAAYCALLLVLASPGARRRCSNWLVLPSPSNQPHLAPLDALRGLAALWVASFHFWQWPRPFLNLANDAVPIIAEGEKAVPIFVVLSGFLVYRAARPISTAQQFRRYLRGRFLRVYPLYFVAVSVAFALAQQGSDVQGLQNFLANAFMLRAIGYPGFIIPAIWSLYAEVLFYLLLPAFIVVAGTRPIAAAAIAYLVLALGHPLGPRELDLWQFFCVGVIASELQLRYQHVLRAPLPLLIFAAGVLLLIADLYYATPDNFDLIAEAIHSVVPSLRLTGRYPNYTLDLALSVALIILGSTWSPAISRIFAWYPWRFLAVVSYSVFVWHGFLIVADLPIAFNGTGGIARLGAMPPPAPAWVMPLVVLPSLLMVGALSFVLIERPFLLRRRGAPGSIAVWRNVTNGLLAIGCLGRRSD